MTATIGQRRRAPGEKPSPRPRRDAGDTESETRAPRTDATLATGSGDTSTPAAPAPDVQDTPTGVGDPRGIELARLVPTLARITIAGGALLIGAAGVLGAIPPHRWPRLALAFGYAAIAGMTLLIGAGLPWAMLHERRAPGRHRA